MIARTRHIPSVGSTVMRTALLDRIWRQQQQICPEEMFYSMTQLPVLREIYWDKTGLLTTENQFNNRFVSRIFLLLVFKFSVD